MFEHEMSKGKEKEENLIRKEEFDSLFVELKKHCNK